MWLKSLAHYFFWCMCLQTWDKFLSQRNEHFIVQYQSPVRWGTAARWTAAGIESPFMHVWTQPMAEAAPGLLGEARPGLLPSHRIHFTVCILSSTLWRCWFGMKLLLSIVLSEKDVRITEFLSFRKQPSYPLLRWRTGVRYVLEVLRKSEVRNLGPPWAQLSPDMVVASFLGLPLLVF